MSARSRRIDVNDVVRVRHAVPQVGLRSGETGVVQCRWFAPEEAFEIEFHAGGIDLPLRVILYEDDVEPAVDDAPLARG